MFKIIGIICTLLAVAVFVVGNTGGPKAGLYYSGTAERGGYIKERSKYVRINFTPPAQMPDGEKLGVLIDNKKIADVVIVNNKVNQRIYKDGLQPGLNIDGQTAVALVYGNVTVAKGTCNE